MAASHAESVHAVTGGGGADSMSRVVEGGSGHFICRVRGTDGFRFGCNCLRGARIFVYIFSVVLTITV